MKSYKQGKGKSKPKTIVGGKKKEEGWNNRFYLGKIPKYDANQDRYPISPMHRTSNDYNQGIQFDRTYSSKAQNRYQLAQSNYPPINPSDTQRERDKEKENAFLEDLSLIQNLWDDLGVLDCYKESFELMARQLEGKAKKDFLEFENQSLKRLRENLNKLSKEITNREKTIRSLQQYDECLSKEPFASSKKVNEDVLEEIIKTIKALRIHSVNVVNHMSKVREISSYCVMNGKYDLDRVNKSYNYDKNYLLKMMTDVDFLPRSSLANYFNFSVESDPFLLNTADERSNTKSNCVTVNEDMIAAIQQSELIIKQDMLFYHIQSNYRRDCSYSLYKGKGQGFDSKNLLRNSSAAQRKIGMSSKLYNTPNMSQFLHQLRTGKDYNQLFLLNNYNNYGDNECNPKSNKKSNPQLKIKIDREEIHSMSRAELVQKIEEFEKLKKDEQNRLQKKKENDEDQEKKKAKEKEKEKENEALRLKEEEKKERLRKIKEKEEEEDKKRKKEKEERERLEKEAEDKRKEEEEEEKDAVLLKQHSSKSHSKKSSLESEISEESDSKNKEEEERQKREKQLEEKLKKEKEEEERLKQEEDDRLQREEEERQRQEDEQRKREEEELLLKKEEEEERIKKEKEDLLKQQKEEEERLKKEEEDRLKQQEEEEEEEKRKQKQEEDKLFQQQKEEEEEKKRKMKENEKEERRFKEEEEEKLGKKEKETQRQDINYPIMFFTQSLANINQFYSLYYASIPEDQKITFKTSPSTNTFTQGLNPKIIVAYNPELTSIIGICQVSYESFSSQSLKLHINHLSTTSPDWKQVLTLIIKFIKAQFTKNEINLLLYYKFDDNEFIIDKEVMSLFKETLNFKWLKIENLTGNERNQLISYQPKEEEEEKEEDSQISPLPKPTLISIDTLTMMNLTSTPFKLKMPFDKYFNIFNATYLLNLLKLHGYTLSSDDQSKSKLIEWNVSTMKADLSNIFTVGAGRADEYSNPFFDLSNLSCTKSDSNEKVYHCTVHYSPKLSSNISSFNENYVYNRIQGNIGILQDKTSKQKFYLIPSEDNSNSIFICELSNELKDQLLNNGQNVYELFYDYYTKLEQNSEDKTLTSALWIPAFSINTHLIADQLAYLDAIKIKTEEDEEKYIMNVDEYIRASYDYDKNIANNFGVEVSENDIVIKKNFLFGLVNVNILSKMSIPSISFLIITQDYWVKASSMG